MFETGRAVVATPATWRPSRWTVAGLSPRWTRRWPGSTRSGRCPPRGRAVGRPGRPARSGQPGPVAVPRAGGRGHGGHAAATRHGRGSGALGGPPRPRWSSWAVLDGGTLVPASLAPGRDRRAEQRRHRRAGRARAVAPGPSARLGRACPNCCWLRALLEHGEYPAPPVLTAVLVNAARATATRTIRDEPLERLPDSPRRADPDAAEPDPDRAGQPRARGGRRPGRRRVRDDHRG